MQIETTRFGPVEIDGDRRIDVPAGLLGFARFSRFALLQPDDRGVFFWLQSADSPDLAFVVTDPALWVPGYSVPLRAEQAQEIGLVNPADAQHFVIVNRRDRSLTANLQGPLVINAAARRGLQVVLADRRWSTRHELVQMEAATRGMAASA